MTDINRVHFINLLLIRWGRKGGIGEVAWWPYSSIWGIVSDGVKDTSLKAKAKDLTLKAKTKNFEVVIEDPRGRGLVLEDSNTETYSLELNVLAKRRILYTFTQ